MKKDNLEIPAFLKRTETEAQAEARRKKAAPKDHSAGLKVAELPNTKITAAIAKDFVDRGRKAQAAVDKVIADAADAKRKDAWKEHAAKEGDKPMTIQRSAKSELAAKAKKMVNDAKRAAPKKVSPLIAKAMKERDALNAKATASKSAKSTTNAEKPAAKSARSGKYDWNAATALAKSGKIPPMPPFNSYRKGHLDVFYDMAKKKDVAGIKKKSADYVDKTGARANMFRFVDLLLVALK